MWVEPVGTLRFSATPRLKAGQELKRNSRVGVRYEAHYVRKDYARAHDYIFSQPLSSFLVAPDAVWEIKHGGG